MTGACSYQKRARMAQIGLFHRVLLVADDGTNLEGHAGVTSTPRSWRVRTCSLKHQGYSKDLFVRILQGLPASPEKSPLMRGRHYAALPQLSG